MASNNGNSQANHEVTEQPQLSQLQLLGQLLAVLAASQSPPVARSTGPAHHEASTPIAETSSTPSRKRSRNDNGNESYNSPGTSDAAQGLPSPPGPFGSQSGSQASKEEEELADAALTAIGNLFEWARFARSDVKAKVFSLGEKGVLSCPLQCGFQEVCSRTDRRNNFSVVDFTKHVQSCITEMLMDHCCKKHERGQFIRDLIKKRASQGGHGYS
ncbi:uncharacterized protein LOC117640021 [Thrips palmi]|uniref:Uncharacterized protein LOC117640021 n=1 Tax=Thrips palmi TaxID=161013 RepID=A0A6P8Y6B1_THRPL|nr:uncharacterized protein LOC117640021 [Thrips palmi]